MKAVVVKSSTYTDFDKKNNKEDPKFNDGNHVRISKYKNIFGKGCIPNRSEEVFVNIKVKNTVPWTYVITDLNGKIFLGTFYSRNCKK